MAAIIQNSNGMICSRSGFSATIARNVLTAEHKKALRKQLIREAASTLELTASDTCAALQDELRDMFPGEYCYVRDVIGDGESGDVIYCCNGETWRAPYEIGMMNGKRTCAIDDDQALNVVPRTVYDEEADESDHYAGMSDTETQEAKAMPSWMRRMVLSERFVSKAERDAADSSDFAGKGKSFPILKPGDVMAAVRSMGRAGSDNKGTAALKASIIRIAKRKGWGKYLPKAWQDGQSASTSESQRNSGHNPDNHLQSEDLDLDSLPVVQASRGREGVSASETRGVQGASAHSTNVPRFTEGTLVLVESAQTLENIVLQEARADYEIKLIAPGKGSSAFYPSEVLKRDGPNVFKAGTHVYLNHPTQAEEAARPEGDVKNLAGVLTTGATYHEAHAKGPGLYARMKVFADHGQMVEEKAPHVGMSIRASGIAESGQKRDGLPVLKELTHATSVDVVTQAGAGGMILTESASGANQQEVDMTAEEIKQLVETAVTRAVAAVTAPVAGLQQRALRGDAMVEANRVLKTVSLHESAKQLIVENSLRDLPLKDGALDVPKFGELVMAEAKRIGSVIGVATGAGHVSGMGAGIGLVPSKEERKKLKEARKEEKRAAKQLREANTDAWEAIGLSPDAAKLAARGGREEVA